MKRSLRHRIFLLSPAYAAGEQAGMILCDEAEFDSREDRVCAAANFREAPDLLSASVTVSAVE